MIIFPEHYFMILINFLDHFKDSPNLFAQIAFLEESVENTC